MNIEKLKQGDKVRVKGMEYTVMYSHQEADPYPGHNPPTRLFYSVYVQAKHSPTLFPTHMLKKYEDSDEVQWFRLVPEALPQDQLEFCASGDEWPS